MNRFEKKKELKKSLAVWIIFSLITILVIAIAPFKPVSNEKAVELAIQYQQKGYYCCGYHYEKTDGTCELVFRNKITNKEETIITDYETAEKIYKEYGDKK